MLSTYQIPYKDAVRVSLGLKKALVDGGVYDVALRSFESRLFDIMQLYGYGHAFISRYRLMSRQPNHSPLTPNPNHPQLHTRVYDVCV